MARKAKANRTKQGNTGANLGFEDKLWAAADKLRGNMDASEYKHVVLGLIFLKYISDAFQERHTWLIRESANPGSDYFVAEEQARYGIAENRDEYLAENIFWVPPEARWNYLQRNAKRPDTGHLGEEDAETALDALDKRNLLSHTYDEETAEEAVSLIREQYAPMLCRLRDKLLEKQG